MKNVVIVGASGMVGNILLKYCLDSNEIGKVTSIGRRKLGIDHPKLKQIVHKDFLNLSGIHPEFQNQDIAYFCIGVYTGAVTDEKFKEITVDYVKSIADVLKQNSPDVNFCLLSGAGADQTEKSKTSFARYKGMAENYLMSQNFGNLHLFRPG